MIEFGFGWLGCGWDWILEGKKGLNSYIHFWAVWFRGREYLPLTQNDGTVRLFPQLYYYSLVFEVFYSLSYPSLLLY